jgi:hypothetical protein
MADSACLAPTTLWQSAEELSERLTIQETKPWTAQLDVVTASVALLCQQFVEANKGVTRDRRGPLNKFLATEHPVWKPRLFQLAAVSNPAIPSMDSLPHGLEDTLQRLESKVKLLQDPS